MSCLKKLLSGLRGRCRSAGLPPARPPTSRFYNASTRRSNGLLQSGRGRLFFGSNSVVCRPPPSHALAFPRQYYSSRKSGKPSDFQFVFHVIAAGVIIVESIRSGTFETVPYTNRSHFIIFSTEEEREEGESHFVNLKKKLGKKILPPSHPDSVRVSGLAKEILRAAHRGLAIAEDEAAANPRNRTRQPQTKHLDGINWEVLVVKNDDVNAFCMPGGKIVVHTGLLDNFKTDAEIATVLGHEIGHVIARHIAESNTKHMWIFVLNTALLTLSDAPQTNEELTSLFLSLPFSRKMEIEADHIGILLLAEAGFDPHIAPAVYEKLGKISGNSSEKNEYRSTHPSSEKRSRLLSDAKVMNKAMAIYRKPSARNETEGFFIFSSEKVSFS